MFLNPPADPIRFATSWLIRADILAYLRALFSIYAFATTITKLAYWSAIGDKWKDGHDFSYYTVLTWWGLSFYFAFAAFHSFTFYRHGRPALSKWGPVLIQLHSILYSTIVVFPFIVTIVFWAILFTSFSSPFDTWSNISQHALNSVFALFELTFSRALPMPWIHLLYLIIILALYLGLAFLTHAVAGWWVYDFLNDVPHGRGRVAAYIFGILALCCVVFVIVHFVILGRVKASEKGGQQGNLVSKGPRDSKKEMEEGRHSAGSG